MRSVIPAVTAAIWLGMASWAGAQGSKPKLHDLKSPDGKVIKAEIVRVDSKNAHIRLGKKELNVPLSKFDAKTKAYLKKWASENIRYNFAARGVHKKLSHNGNVHEYGYDVTLESRMPEELHNVEVRYQVYNTEAEMRPGTQKIRVLLPRGEIVFKTIAGSRTRDRRLWRWDGEYSTAGSIGNHLGGIWLRVYHKDKMVFEHKNFSSKVRSVSWKHK